MDNYISKICLNHGTVLLIFALFSNPVVVKLYGILLPAYIHKDKKNNNLFKYYWIYSHLELVTYLINFKYVENIKFLIICYLINKLNNNDINDIYRQIVKFDNGIISIIKKNITQLKTKYDNNNIIKI